MRHRWSGAVLAVLVLVPLLVASPAAAAEGDFIVDGGGWGHGVGMSQYGARAMAIDGQGVDGAGEGRPQPRRIRGGRDHRNLSRPKQRRERGMTPPATAAPK